ncbi:hypothetical protein LCGC14_0772460, partial [marine sediment metagenome]
MHGRINLHGHPARIDALEFFVDFQDAAELQVERRRRDVRQIEIDAQAVLLDAQALGGADVEDFARGDVARHQVAVFRIALFEKVVSLGFGDLAGQAPILWFARDPQASAFAAGAFAHQAQLVGAGDGGGMDLDEFGVAVFGPRLEGAAGRVAGADHR